METLSVGVLVLVFAFGWILSAALNEYSSRKKLERQKEVAISLILQSVPDIHQSRRVVKEFKGKLPEEEFIRLGYQMAREDSERIVKGIILV